MFVFFVSKYMPNTQTNLKLGNFCINQMLSVTYEEFTFEYLNIRLEVKYVFSNISKTFHEDLCRRIQKIYFQIETKQHFC